MGIKEKTFTNWSACKYYYKPFRYIRARNFSYSIFSLSLFLLLSLSIFLSFSLLFFLSFLLFIYLITLEKKGAACAPQPGSPTLLWRFLFSFFTLPLSLSLTLAFYLSHFYSFFLSFFLFIFNYFREKWSRVCASTKSYSIFFISLSLFLFLLLSLSTK